MPGSSSSSRRPAGRVQSDGRSSAGRSSAGSSSIQSSPLHMPMLGESAMVLADEHKQSGGESPGATMPLFWGMLAETFITSCIYYFCLSFTRIFTNRAQRDTTLPLTMGFLIVLQCGRVAARIAGKYIDSHRAFGGVSLELISFIDVEIFSAVFYRNLFSTVESYQQFFLLKLARLIIDLIVFPVQLIPGLDHAHDAVRSHSRLYAALTPPGKLLPQRMAINLTIHTMLAVQSSIAYLIFWSFLRYGYNQDFFPTVNDQSDADFSRLCEFVVIGAVMEISFFFGVNILMHRRTTFSLWAPLRAAFTTHPEYLWYMTGILAHVTGDVFLAYRKRP
uniref:Uncharacterized protein n=1 Tax=Rhizochromulina marina TaxID=1034831 RepID=A0A7S2RQM3_9STRA